MRRVNVVERYNTVSSNYRKKNPALTDITLKENVYCACGKTLLKGDYKSHRALHDRTPPDGQWILTMPYRTANSLISNGKPFVHVLKLFSSVKSTEYPEGRAASDTDYNALMLKDWSVVVDSNDTSVKWSVKANKFIRTTW